MLLVAFLMNKTFTEAQPFTSGTKNGERVEVSLATLDCAS